MQIEPQSTHAESSETVEDVLARIERSPEDADLHQRLGKLYLQSGHLEAARNAYLRSLELDPKDAFTHLFLGNLHYQERLYPEALARFQIAAELMPDEPIVYTCLGDAYHAQGRFDLADKAYETAARKAPDDPVAQGKQAAWHESRDGITDQTKAMIRTAYCNDQAATVILLAERWLKEHPDDFWVIIDYASMLYQVTRYDDAIRVYLDAAERFEDSGWCLYNQLGHLHRYKGDFPSAETWFQKAITEEPDEVASYVFLGAVQATQGKLTEAEATHRKATLCIAGPVDEAWHNLGLVLRAQGRLSEAADSFRKAIELTPKYPEAIEALQDVEAALALSREHG